MIVTIGISNQYLIEGKHLGLVVVSLDEAVERVKNMGEAEYPITNIVYQEKE